MNFPARFSTLLLRKSICYPPSTLGIRNLSGEQDLVQDVVLSKDRKMFVAWHPTKDFPYEFSKPIPTRSETDSGSLIKEEALQNALSAFKSKHPEVARQELMNLTYTTKHRWFPRSRDKKAKKTPMDREYL